MRTSAGLLPRQELALVVTARAMGLPRQATAALFVLGRLAGWVAHVQEQRADGTLLRPRAKFVKPVPRSLPPESLSEGPHACGLASHFRGSCASPCEVADT
jgi:citrate synthase